MTPAPKPFRFRRRTTVPGIAREMLRCFADERRWTRGTLARDACGNACDAVTDDHAVSWCAMGAALAINAELEPAFGEAFIALGEGNEVNVNDDLGLPALRRVLRKLARPRRRS